MDIMKLMKNAGKIKEMLSQQQDALAKKSYQGESGAGWVTVTMVGNRVSKIDISPEALKEDKEIIEELIAAAMNDCIKKSEQDAQSSMSSMGNMFGGMESDFLDPNNNKDDEDK